MDPQPNAFTTSNSLDGAEFDGPTTIGGVGTLGGQVDFNAATDAKNVTGGATAASDSFSTDGLDTDAATTISSDGTLQGFTNLISSADAVTTKGNASAISGNNLVDGADLNTVDIGGVGSLTGQNNIEIRPMPPMLMAATPPRAPSSAALTD